MIGYESVTVPYRSLGWGGLRWNNSAGKAILEGSTGPDWWYAVGSFGPYNGENKILGPDGEREEIFFLLFRIFQIFLFSEKIAKKKAFL